MPKIASQPIASRFGTYREGEVIDEEAAGPVLEAWEAAGLIEDGPVTADVDAPKPQTATKMPKTSKPPKPETATKPAPERRVTSAPKAHKRFTADAAPVAGKPEQAPA